MSPEQARGATAVGPQSDQFALGLVLYEIATGRRAFPRNSAAETLAAIIRDDPEPLPETTPAPLRWVIDRLLSKDPADRYDSTHDLHRELRHVRDRLTESTSASGPIIPAKPAPRPRHVPSAATSIILALAGVLLGGTAAAIWFTSQEAPATATDLSKYTFSPVTLDATREIAPVWAPDGKSIAYIVDDNGAFQVFTRAIGSFESVQITRSAAGGTNPFWSPDGSLIYFMSRGANPLQAAVWAIRSTGGTPEIVFDPAESAAAHPDGKTLVFVREGKFWTGRRGEEPREFAVGNELASAQGSRRLFGFSPDGKLLACLAGGALWMVPYPSGSPRHLPVSDVFSASWMPDNRQLVVTQPDTDSSRISIVDVVTADARTFYAAPGTVLGAQVSPDGSNLLVTFQQEQADVVEISTADGRVRTMLASRFSSYPDWSPSGTRFLFGTGHAIEEAAAGERFSRPVIVAPSQTSVGGPRWAPDGTQFILNVTADYGTSQLMIANASGRMLPLDPQASGGTRRGIWTSDGQVIYERTIEGRTEVARVRPGSTGAPQILASSPRGDVRHRPPLSTSPDGNWILARSVGMNPQLFLVAPDYSRERALPSERLNVSSIGFSKDSREVMSIYHNTSGDGARWQLWAVDVATGRERLVTRIDLPDSTQQIGGFSLHPDGTRILTSAASSPSDIWMLKGFDKR
jgi:Tol biopolymer transport system component